MIESTCHQPTERERIKTGMVACLKQMQQSEAKLQLLGRELDALDEGDEADRSRRRNIVNCEIEIERLRGVIELLKGETNGQ